jgi:hypothetical protein
LERIFTLFPPAQERPLSHEVLTEVQICLHAFVINLSGVFDNWAWAFVLRHELMPAIGDHRNIGMFKAATQRLLPSPLREYVTSPEISDWQDKYLKGYRDALAHRVPLYIPPAAWTPQDAERYQELEQEKIACIRNRQWEQLDRAWAEQDAVGLAYPVFLHEFSEDERARPVYLHPQLLSDSATVTAFGRRFYGAWGECVRA